MRIAIGLEPGEPGDLTEAELREVCVDADDGCRCERCRLACEVTRRRAADPTTQERAALQWLRGIVAMVDDGAGTGALAVKALDRLLGAAK